MREIVFAGALVEIIQHMLNTRRLSLVIEDVPIVRKSKDQRSSRLEYPPPFHQSFDRIGKVLQIVGGQYKVIGRVSNLCEGRALTKKRLPRRLYRIDDKSLAVFCPDGRPGKVAIVQSFNFLVDRNRIVFPEDVTWAANFQSAFSLDVRQVHVKSLELPLL